jgi:DUF4097 and DUF4098 domain-containing protein YvlB
MVTLLASVLCIVLVAAAVARPIDERRAAAPDVRVTVENLNGTVSVEGWDREEVEVTGDLDEDAEELEFEGSERRLRIEVHYPRHSRNIHADTELNIKVPTGASVRVEVINAPIDVAGVEGELELEAVNGDITVSGEPSSLRAETVNGDVEVVAQTQSAEVSTVGGRILLEGVSGEVAAATVGGSIRVRGGEFNSAEFGSVSGDIEFLGDLNPNGRFDFESHNGDVVLELPADVSAEFDVNTFSGDIDNDFGPTGQRKSRHGPGRELYFSTGGGDARVDINTFSGDVRILKR